MPSSLRDDLTKPGPGWKDVKVEPLPAPPGFEESLLLEYTVVGVDAHIRSKRLSYRDERGLLFSGRCSLNAEVPECEFNAEVPGTSVQFRYRLVETLLPHRAEIEQGLQALIRKWMADGK